MDVNDTRFHLLLGEKDWMGTKENSESDLEWDIQHFGLILTRLPFIFPEYKGDKKLEPAHRRGADRDRYGNWFWIDEKETGIFFSGPEGTGAERFWSVEDFSTTQRPENDAGDFQPVQVPSTVSMTLSGLVVTGLHYLMVGVRELKGLLIFDLYERGPPVLIPWPENENFLPFDMAHAPDCSVWILDKDNRYFWKLDRHFRAVRFASKAEQPVAIEGLLDGTVLILDNDTDITVYRYRLGQSAGSVSLRKSLKNHDIRGTGHDIAFLPTDKSGNVGTLYMVATDGNQAFAFDIDFKDEGTDFSVTPLFQYYPLRLFDGKGLVYPLRLYDSKGLVSDGQDVFYDLQNRWLHITEQSRPRYKKTGMMETRVFDGKEPDCVWHRLFLDAYIPPGTEVLFESKAANEQEHLDQIPWQKEPRPYRRSTGPEIPYYQAFQQDQLTLEGIGTWELLFQQALGRYLKLRLTLQGTGNSTPMLRALRVYYPRFSYLKEYLPAVYRDDRESASFLDRFLANMEGMYTELEGRIEKAQMLFDVRTVSAEYLEWLAGWFGVILDPAWDETRRRLFISHAMQLFAERGTTAGLIHAIRLSTDPCPDESLFEQDAGLDVQGKSLSGEIVLHSVRIVERYLTRSTPGVVYGDPGQVEGPGVTTDIEKWTPAHGAEYIHEQFRAYLDNRYGENDKPVEALNKAWDKKYGSLDEIVFPPVLPKQPAIQEDWIRFTQQWLGFTYAAVVPDDKAAYQRFLMRRNQSNVASISGIDPDVLPPGGEQLNNWIQFVSKVLPINKNAHRFTVLVPTNPEDDIGTQKQLLDHVRRIVELEKPAHTEFDLIQYWDLFRVGEARLGLDTQLSRGSRYVSLLLGKSSLMESFLGTSKEHVHERVVIDENEILPAGV